MIDKDYFNGFEKEMKPRGKKITMAWPIIQHW